MQSSFLLKIRKESYLKFDVYIWQSFLIVVFQFKTGSQKCWNFNAMQQLHLQPNVGMKWVFICNLLHLEWHASPKTLINLGLTCKLPINIYSTRSSSLNARHKESASALVVRKSLQIAWFFKYIPIFLDDDENAASTY